jgi:hypothetical protein
MLSIFRTANKPASARITFTTRNVPTSDAKKAFLVINHYVKTLVTGVDLLW